MSDEYNKRLLIQTHYFGAPKSLKKTDEFTLRRVYNEYLFNICYRFCSINKMQ